MKLSKQFTYALLSICIINNLHSANLHEAAKKNKVTTMVQCLINGANIDGCDEDGRTALTYAIEKGHVAAVQCLLRYGADPNYAPEGKDVPLLYLGRYLDSRTLATKKRILDLLCDRQVSFDVVVPEARECSRLKYMQKDDGFIAIIHAKMAEQSPEQVGFLEDLLEPEVAPRLQITEKQGE